MECSVDGCDRRSVARGWCDRHYQRWKAHGDPERLLRVRADAGTPLPERFWSKVSRGTPHDCWEWAASRSASGYGRLNVDGKYLKSHRLAWELVHGAIPDGLCVLHHCDNPPCCNPAHLFLGTQMDNSIDKYAKGRGPLGENHWAARLNPDAVRQMRAMRKNGDSYPVIAQRFGVSRMTARNAIVGDTWSHVS